MLPWKKPVRAKTTAALAANTYANGTSGVGATLTGNANGALAAVDGVTLAANDRVLVDQEATGSHNGIYVVTQVGDSTHPYILTRATDADSSAELVSATCKVSEGTTFADQEWQCTTNATITVGTTTLVWARADDSAPNVQAVTSAATVTPTFSNDLVKVTAQAVALTLANWSGTAVPAWGMGIRIKDNGTARVISYGTKYRAMGVTLPTATVVGKTVYLGCIYNSDDDMIDVVAVCQQA